MRTNRHGCKPDGDVCMAHHMPLDCRHGCKYADEHRCAGWTPMKYARKEQIVRRGMPAPREDERK